MRKSKAVPDKAGNIEEIPSGWPLRSGMPSCLFLVISSVSIRMGVLTISESKLTNAAVIAEDTFLGSEGSKDSVDERLNALKRLEEDLAESFMAESCKATALMRVLESSWEVSVPL